MYLFSAKTCSEPPPQKNGEKDVCVSPYEYGDSCTFRCLSGYQLPDGSSAELQCRVGILADGSPSSFTEWDAKPTACEGTSQHHS